MAGARRFVCVLQLLGDHPQARVQQAIEACRREQLTSAEAVIQRTRTLAAIELRARPSPFLTTELATVPQVHVPLPDLSRFDHLLDSRASRDDAGGKRFAVAANKAVRESPVAVFFT
jgi:hypothetical protein